MRAGRRVHPPVHGHSARSRRPCARMTVIASLTNGSPWTRRLSVKVPQVTSLFWILTLLAIIVGETAATSVAADLALGPSATTAILGLILASALVWQISAGSVSSCPLLARGGSVQLGRFLTRRGPGRGPRGESVGCHGHVVRGTRRSHRRTVSRRAHPRALTLLSPGVARPGTGQRFLLPACSVPRLRARCLMA